MAKRLSQADANDLIFAYMYQANVCMTKRSIVRCLMLSYNSVSKGLTYLRKKRLVTYFRSNRRAYWGVIDEGD